MKMKTSHYVYALAISALAACATDDGGKAKPDAPASPATSAPRAPSAVSAQPAIPKPAIDTTIAWKQGKELDLAEAQAFASKAQAMKMPVTVRTARAQKRDEALNKTEQFEAVKNVALRPLATDKISRNDKIWAEVVRQLGKHAAQANAREPQQIVVSITAGTKARVTQWLNEGVAAANNSQKPDIQFFDAKLAKDTAIFYQPLDQKQFN